MPIDGRRARGRKRIGFSSVASPSPRPLPGGGRTARRLVANRSRWVVRGSRRGIAERTVPAGATPDLSKTRDAGSLSLGERARVRGNETPPTKTPGRTLQAQLHRFPDSELSCQARFGELSRLNWWKNELLQHLRRQTHIKFRAVRNLISRQRPSSPSFAAATKMKLGLAIRIRFCYMSPADPESTR